MTGIGYNGDALFEATPDGGSITFVNGDPTRSGGLPGAVYISLFGGNGEQWWGDTIDDLPGVVGRTGQLLDGIALSGPNLRRVEESALVDLQWMLDHGVASNVEATAVIEAAKRMRLTVEVEAEGEIQTFVFTENWRAER